MKYLLHIPVEQYGFIQVDEIESREQAITEYKLVAKEFTNEGIPIKEFEEVIDLMIEREPIQGDPGIVENFSAPQKWAFDLVRKSINRIDYKNR